MTEAELSALSADPRVTWTEDVIRFGDTDMNGHVNNSAFAFFAESGRVHLFRTALGDRRDPDHFFVVAKLVIEFKAELHYPGRVRTGSWLTRRTALAATVPSCADAVSRRPSPSPRIRSGTGYAVVRAVVGHRRSTGRFTSSAMPWSAASTGSNDTVPWPPGTTSWPCDTSPPSASPRSASGSADLPNTP